MQVEVHATCGLLELRSGHACDLCQSLCTLNVSHGLEAIQNPRPGSNLQTSIFQGFALIIMSNQKELILTNQTTKRDL